MSNARIHVILTFALMAIVVLWADPVRGEDRQKSRGDIIIGAKAGYSLIEGYYKNRFRGSYTAGGTFSYGNRGIVPYLMGEMDLFYSRYPMKESDRSYLETVSLAAGPLFYYPIVPHFQAYLGASAMGSYVHLFASRSHKNVKSLKPGLLAKAGFFFPIKSGFMIRAGAEYSLQYLSGKPLHGVNFIGGISYNFNPEEEVTGVVPAGDTAARIDWYLTLAGNALRKGKTDEAKDNYAKALALDSTNREARDQLAGIKKAEGDYETGMKLAKDKRYYEALPVLDSAGKYLPAAREEQEKIRKHLSADTALLEKQGIELYEKGDYRGCINVMNRLLLIDPKNRVGLIYLPRAVKRQGALERLR
ncbi:MAG TPA: hypothetical protein PKN50_16050 [Spirochaetota bacterium]|nr:hypothetical protein [Spirochaetota bacterium]HPV40962.1 hypothetical protein [Spirochaetota bacterium]